MSQSNTDIPGTDARLADASAQIRFGFQTRSLIDNKIGINENSVYIDEIEKPMTAKTDIVLADDMGTLVLMPMNYTMTMPIRRIDRPTLDDKYQTALTYIDRIVTDTHRNFNPQLIIAGARPVRTFNEHEDVLRGWGMDKFQTDPEKRVIGSNLQVSLTYKGGPAVQL